MQPPPRGGTSGPIAGIRRSRLPGRAGKDTTYLSLNANQESGLPGQPVTLHANLTDIVTTPVSTIAGATVTISLAGRSCTAQTDAASWPPAK
jgi:hypothetical protein